MNTELIESKLSRNIDNDKNINKQKLIDDKDKIKEEILYNYHKFKNTSSWQIAKTLCKISYALFDTNYLGDEMDSIINFNKSINELTSDDLKLNIVNSYTFLYKNINQVIIEFLIDSDKNKMAFTGPEAKHILENLKVPDYTQLRKKTYYEYFTSYLFNNYPKSYTLNGEEQKIKFTNIWIYHEDKTINFYYNPNTQQFDYKIIIS
jgi:hypothetical protein